MSGSNEQQPQPPPDLNAAIQALIQQHIAAASGQGNQVQLPTLPAPQAQSQYSNDPDKGPDLLARIGLAIGGGSLPGAPAELRQQMGKQALLNFGVGLLGAGRFSTPGEALAGGLRGAQSGLLGSEAAQAGQQEYALNAQTELAKLGMEQQKNRTAALTALVPLLQMQGRLGLPPLYGGGGPGGAGPGGGDTAFTGDPDKDLPMIAQRESGGDPTALNYVAKADPTAYARGATASGKYQMVNSTWLTAAKAAGIDTDKYPTARDAPEALQDQAARKLYAMQGTAPWDASKFGANWVKQQDGTYQLVKGAQPPASGPGSPVGPYKVASRENVPPPAAAPPAPAQPATPPGVMSPGELPGASAPGPVGPVAAAAAPAQPPAPPAAAPPAPAQPPAQPPAPTRDLAARNADGTYVVPDTSLNAEENMQRHFTPATPEEVRRYAPGPTGDEAAAAADQVQRSRQNVAVQQRLLDEMHRAAIPADAAAIARQGAQVTDAQKELDAAENAYNDQVQKLAQSGATNLLNRDTKERERVSADYKASVVDPRNKAAELTQQGQQAIEQAKITAGLTFHNTMEENDAKAAQEQVLAPMAGQALKSHNLNLGLAQLQGVLPQLPKGGGALGVLLNEHPDWAPALAAFGNITSDQADAVQLINGLVAGLTTEMKPAGLGALREYEFDAFKARLPKLLSTTEGQQKAVAYLMNLNNRIQDENTWTQNYFRRQVPDERSDKPGATRKAFNLDSNDQGHGWQQQMDNALGPIVAAYVPSDATRKAGGEPAWEASLPPGKPYYRPHSDGSTTLEVRGVAGG